MNQPEATAAALAILRNPATFQWYVIPLLALVVYVYANEIQHRNWRGVAAGLALYVVHWFCEIVNALIQHFSGHALWTVPTGTAFLLLIGVGIEISFMFSIAGLVFSKLLPADPKAKIFGLNNRLVFTLGNAAFFAVVRNLSGADANLCMGVSVVGRAAGLCHGVHSVLCGGLLRARLAPASSGTVHRYTGRDRRRRADSVCRSLTVDLNPIDRRPNAAAASPTVSPLRLAERPARLDRAAPADRVHHGLAGGSRRLAL